MLQLNLYVCEFFKNVDDQMQLQPLDSCTGSTKLFL